MSTSTVSTTSGLPERTRRPGDFLAPLYNFFDRIAQNPKRFFGFIIVFISIATVAMWVTHMRDTKTVLAKNAFFQAKKVLDKDLLAIAEAEPRPVTETKSKDGKKEAEKPLPPADIHSVAFKKFDVDAKLSAGLGMMKKVAQDFDGTAVAFDARLVLGDLYYSHGDLAKASPWYEQAAGSAPSAFERALALSSLGYSLESSGKPADAVAVYEKALNQGESALRGDLLLAVARCHELTRDMTKAKATYDQIISQMPETEYAKKAELFKSQLE